VTGSVHYCNFSSFRGIGVASCPHCMTVAGYVLSVDGGENDVKCGKLHFILQGPPPTYKLQLYVWYKMSHMSGLKYYFTVLTVELWLSHVPGLISLETSGTTLTFCFCLFLILRRIVHTIFCHKVI